MSIEYCFKHDATYDTDYVCECSECEEEAINKEEYSNQIKNQLTGMFKGFGDSYGK
jgi:hypothetical protein